MKTYLVTGAAGFIGGAVAQKLVNQGHRVVTIDNLTTGRIENIPEGVEFIEGNCFDMKISEKLSKYRFEAIFHIAGQSSGEISFDNPVYDLQTNAQSTLMLLNYAKRYGCSKLIYASTMSVYGDQPDFPIDESYLPKPKSFYGVGKLASEHYLRIYSANYGLATSALRLFNVYGPGQNLKNMRQGMASIFITQALLDQKILVKGEKRRYRDFIFIDDVVDAFLAIEKRVEMDYECFNVCNHYKVHVEEVVEQINKNLEKSVPVAFEGITPGDQFGIVGDNKKLMSYLDWQPRVDFESGMKRMVEWAKKQF
jgi:UDP-glucose 4-epimerase